MPARRTTHRSSAGKKLYAVRDAEGKFKDIQTYERAHAQDIKRGSGKVVGNNYVQGRSEILRSERRGRLVRKGRRVGVPLGQV